MEDVREASEAVRLVLVIEGIEDLYLKGVSRNLQQFNGTNSPRMGRVGMSRKGFPGDCDASMSAVAKDAGDDMMAEEKWRVFER